MSVPPLTIGAEEQLFTDNVLASPSQNSPMAAAPASLTTTLPASTTSSQIPVVNNTAAKVPSTPTGEGSSQVQCRAQNPINIIAIYVSFHCEMAQLNSYALVSCSI